jgi:hypothetical protein
MLAPSGPWARISTQLKELVMATAGAASLADLTPARAAASRRNGARSRGPKTPEGKARSALNALKHGLRARYCVVLGDEDLQAFHALEDALLAELAPQGALQSVLARRIVAASWRLERTERIEAELLAHNMRDTASFGLGIIRDCNGPRAFDTLLRYRGTTLAELWRSLRTLEALQAKAAAQAAEEAAAQQGAAAPAVPEVLAPAPARAAATPALAPALAAQPIKPDNPGNPGDSAWPTERANSADGSLATAAWRSPQPLPVPAETVPCARPIEPETRRQPAGPAAPAIVGAIEGKGRASLLAGTALATADRSIGT